MARKNVASSSSLSGPPLPAKIGVLGTGMVGRAHAEKLSELGYDVAVGTRDVSKTLSVAKTDESGNIPFAQWQRKHAGVKLMPFAEAARHGEMVIEAISGEAALKTLSGIAGELEGKVLIDIANALEFSGGTPSLLVSNTDSLGEQIQKALPATKVIKMFNSVTAELQVDPKRLAGGDHDVFISGNDAKAKAAATSLAKTYGWKNIIDLGDLTGARSQEMLLPMWMRLWDTLKTEMFNFKIVKK